MVLFAKKGQEPEDLIVKWTAEIEKRDIEISELQRAPEAKQARIDALALPAENGDEDAVSEIENLEREIARDKKLLRQKQYAQKVQRADLAAKVEGVQQRADALLRKKAAALLLKEEAIVERIDKNLRLTVEDRIALRDLKSTIAQSWRSTWPSGDDALLSSDSSYGHSRPRPYGAGLVDEPGFAALMAHHIFELCQEFGISTDAAIIPAPRWTQQTYEWKGLGKRFRQLNKALRDKLLSGETCFGEPAVEAEPISEPVATLEPSAPLAMSNEDIARNNALGNPLGLPLSGGAWTDLQEHAKSSSTIAEGTNFDVFDPSQPI